MLHTQIETNQVDVNKLDLDKFDFNFKNSKRDF